MQAMTIWKMGGILHPACTQNEGVLSHFNLLKIWHVQMLFIAHFASKPTVHSSS